MAGTGLLAAGAVLAAIAAALGVVSGDVPDSVASAATAALAGLLPALIAVALTLSRPQWGAAVTAGAGIISLGRLCADLAVLWQPASVARPELFYPLSGRAFPLRVNGIAALLPVADLLMVLGGVLAARALTRRLADRADDLDQPERPSNGALLGAGFLALALLGVGAAQNPYAGGYIVARNSLPGTDIGSLALPFVVVLIALAAVILSGTLPRALAVSLLGGMAATAVVPAVVALWVAASGAPVELTSGPVVLLIGGIALTLTGLTSATRWRRPADATGPDAAGHHAAGADGDAGDAGDAGGPSSDYLAPTPDATRWPLLAAAAAAAVAGVAALVGAAVPRLLADGARPAAAAADASGVGDVFGGVSAAAGAVLMLAAVATLSGLLPAAAAPGRCGRGALLVLWAVPALAVAAPLTVLSSLQTATAEADRAIAGSPDLAPELGGVVRWTAGPGLYLLGLAALFAVVAALLALLAQSASEQSASEQSASEQSASEQSAPEGESSGAATDRSDGAELTDLSKAGPAWQLPALVVVGVIATLALLAPPLYRIDGPAGSAGNSQGGLFDTGDGAVWAQWLLAAVCCVAIAVTAGALRAEAPPGRRMLAAGSLLGAAAATAVRQLVPATVPDAVAGAGSWCGWLLAGLLLAGAVLLVVAGRGESYPSRNRLRQRQNG